MRLLHAACASAGVPLVFTAHNAIPHDTEGASRDVIRRNLEQADLIIVHSDNVAKSLREEVRVDARLQPIPHPAFHTDLDLPSRESAAAALSLKEGPVVLFAGIVRPYKGLDLLAEAWPLVREAFPTATLLVVGRALGEEAQGQLLRVGALPGVRVAAKYVPMKTMIDYHVASDVVVFPYRAISQSGALMTALGLGRPAVVTPIPGLSEQAVGISSVVVAPSADGRGIAEATVAALRDSEALGAKAAEERRRLAASPLGWPSVARRTIEAYEQALTERSRPSRGRGAVRTTP
jgi:glycosyltransferase involved in cell wall biosynthesis